ncbi:acyltransferase [Larkinella soli]|uniref:acyltransferase n=1 Tax=Larkinella soli TaxID=1770527 RepID=UPI000FFB7CF5|nr:acyltransferase [Larkinella soli]
MRPDFFFYKSLHWAYRKIRQMIDPAYTRWLFKMNGVEFGEGLYSRGIPDVYIAKGGKMKVGRIFRLNNGRYHNMAGREQDCLFSVEAGGTLTIGDNVAVSSFAVICTQSITIGNNVRIGGNTCICDSDFHSLRHTDRIAIPENEDSVVSKPVVLEDNCFVGSHCTVMKGVRIGARSVVGSGSVVTKSIPPDEIWAGNPARFIRKIDEEFLQHYTGKAARENSVAAS